MSAPFIALTVANLVIILGYLFAAVRVAPVLPGPLLTKCAAVAFFTTCGMTHFEQFVHMLEFGGVGGEEHIPHLLWIHAPQALAIWLFVIGFSRTLRRYRAAVGSCAHSEVSA